MNGDEVTPITSRGDPEQTVKGNEGGQVKEEVRAEEQTGTEQAAAVNVGTDAQEAVRPSDPELERKFEGMPPPGSSPLPPGYTYAAWVAGLVIMEICIWGVYRYFSAPYISPFGSIKFNLAHMVAAPSVHLIPIILFWRFIRKEKGLPFTFTTKNLISSVVVGLFAAIMWRVMEMFCYDILATAAGGYVSGTRDFYSLMDETTFLVFSLNTLVQFFVVGPVEEMTFRSFAFDQTARVLPKWGAVLLSSILFGFTHIPIALFVYKMTFLQLFVAEIGWMTAGVTFAALYMWSRNIVGCIVMHGMGNWQLSVFFFSSSYKGDGLSVMTDIVVGTINSIIINAVMVVVFYVIYRLYWRPRYEGKMPLEGLAAPIRTALSQFKPGAVVPRAVPLGLLTVLVCGMVLGAAFAWGETDMNKLLDSGEDGEGDGSDLSSLVPVNKTYTGTESLEAGQSFDMSVPFENESVPRSVNVTITWKDEADMQRIRTYENQPDSFSVEISGPSGKKKSASGENEHGKEGKISTSFQYTDEEMQAMLSGESGSNGGNASGGASSISLTVTMVEAGMFAPSVGLIGYTDSGNDFTYSVEIVWMAPESTGSSA